MSWKISSAAKSSHLLKIHNEQLSFFRDELAKDHPELWAEFEKMCLIVDEHNEYRAHMEYLEREYPGMDIIPHNLQDIWRAFSRQAFIMSEDARQVSILADLYHFGDKLKELEVLRSKAEKALDAADTLRRLRESVEWARHSCDDIDIHVDGGEAKYLEAVAYLKRLKVKTLLAELNLRLLTESCPEQLFEIQEEIESLVACSLDLLITEEPEIEVELVLEDGSTLIIEGDNDE